MDTDVAANLTKTDLKKKVKKILVSQPEPQGPRSPYFDLSEQYKLKIDFRQFIQIEGISTKEFRKLRIHLNDYSGVIFTSRTSIDHFFRLCDELRVKMSQETKYFCISEAIALYLQKYIQYRKRKVFYGNGSYSELKEILLKYKEREKILFLCSNVRDEHMPNFLSENGFDYREGAIYHTVASDISDLKLKSYDMIVFFSPSGVKSLFSNFPNFKQGDIQIAAFGPATCKEVEDSGLTLNLKAPVPEARSMTKAIEVFIEQNK